MSLQHLILGLLNDAPASGYDLNKLFQGSVGNFWTTDQSQIYRALHKLLENGWVETETIIQDQTPNKKVYHLTPTGLDELRRWIATPLPQDDAVRIRRLGQVFFGDLVDRDDLLNMLKSDLEKLRAAQAHLAAIEARVFPRIESLPLQQQLRLMTLKYGLMQYEFEIRWYEELIDLVERNHD